MRVIILYIGLSIADAMSVGGILSSDKEAAELILKVIAVLFVYAAVLDLWKTT